MNCTQNHKTPVNGIPGTPAVVNEGGPNCNKYVLPPKQRMTPDETFVQWLKIIGLSIALGVMVYQTYLIKIISEK